MIQGLRGSVRAAMIAVLILVIAAAALMIGAGQLRTGVSGATNLAVGVDQQVWLALDGALLRLSADGKEQAAYSLHQLGIEQLCAIVPMPQGSLWIGSRSSKRLYLLSADGHKLAEAAPPASAGPFFELIHAAYEPTSDRLLVSDTQNHRLMSFTGSGQFVAVSGAGTDVRFPNGLAAAPQGLVLLADTNHHAVEWIRPDLSLAPGTIEAPTMAQLKSGFLWSPWPVFVGVAPDGRFYASWHGAKLLLGAVLAYAADGHYLHTLPLDEAAEPQAVLARDQDVLVALKTGQDFSIERFDRDGRDLGSFGDASVQSRLAYTSRRAANLLRLQSLSRIIVIGGGLVLLICALRLQRRSELGAAEVVIKLQRQAPRGNTVVLIAVLLGVFIVLVIAQLVHIGLGVQLVLDARQKGSHWLLLVARWVVPVVMVLVLMVITMAWRSTPAFLDLQTRLIKRRLQSWAPFLPALLAPGEEIEDFGLAPTLWRARLLLATNRRLMLFLGSAGYSHTPLWQAPWAEVAEARLLPKPWWLWLINPVSAVVELSIEGQKQPLRLYAVSRTHADQLLEMIRAGRERNFARTQRLTPPATPPGPVAKPRPSRPLRGALLSLIFPGLGQMDQGRTRQGLGLMLLALLILSSGLLSWLIFLRRFADQPMFDPILLALLYVPVLAYGVWDAARYAREVAGAGRVGTKK